jgi:hypothetical protein
LKSPQTRRVFARKYLAVAGYRRLYIEGQRSHVCVIFNYPASFCDTPQKQKEVVMKKAFLIALAGVLASSVLSAAPPSKYGDAQCQSDKIAAAGCARQNVAPQEMPSTSGKSEDEALRMRKEWKIALDAFYAKYYAVQDRKTVLGYFDKSCVESINIKQIQNSCK